MFRKACHSERWGLGWLTFIGRRWGGPQAGGSACMLERGRRHKAGLVHAHRRRLARQHAGVQEQRGGEACQVLCLLLHTCGAGLERWLEAGCRFKRAAGGACADQPPRLQAGEHVHTQADSGLPSLLELVGSPGSSKPMARTRTPVGRAARLPLGARTCSARRGALPTLPLHVGIALRALALALPRVGQA